MNKHLKHSKFVKTIVLCLGMLSLFSFSAIATNYTTGNVQNFMRFYPDYMLFLLNADSPCGEAPFILEKSHDNYQELFYVIMKARETNARVEVESDSCVTWNQQFALVYTVHLL